MSASENGSESSPEKGGWKPGRRDAFFLAFVAAVVLLLMYGTGERTTRPTPNDAKHQQAASRTACMECHSAEGVRPQPERHTKADQCFQCHIQPEGWVGAR
ncbi:MAG: hypothetical protein RQ867_03025 [Mariprofundaceae bacterium]|nr:hypothetical protein [Mariprofundaceae bacterium]